MSPRSALHERVLITSVIAWWKAWHIACSEKNNRPGAKRKVKVIDEAKN